MGTSVSVDHAAFVFRVVVSRGRMLMGEEQVGRRWGQASTGGLPTTTATT
jgi:hypothetical protein